MPPSWSHHQKCHVVHQDTTVRWDWIYDNCYTTKRLYTSLHKNHSPDRCPDLWWKTTFHCEMTKRVIRCKERRTAGAGMKLLPSTDVACSIQTLPFTDSLVTRILHSCPLSSYYILTTCEIHLNWVGLTHRNSDGETYNKGALHWRQNKQTTRVCSSF